MQIAKHEQAFAYKVKAMKQLNNNEQDERCLFCKGKLENKLTTFMLDLDGCILIVKNVPSQVCTQCGEVSYSTEVVTQLTRIADKVRESMSEITVINYHTAA